MKLYKNSNGRTYEIIATNTDYKIAVLLPINPTFKNAPYIVVFGFDANIDSWACATYDLTLHSAINKFNSFIA